jgi:nucleotide-binding universal stress UspA family protein
VPERTTAPFARILVPLDGSEPSAMALRYGIALAHGGASLTLFAAVDLQAVVAETTTMMDAGNAVPLIDDLIALARERLEGARARAQEAGVAATVVIEREPPVAGILAAAQAHASDLIVMGTHGRAGAPRVFLGSTTEGVLRASTSPVLTVRPDMPDPPVGFFHRVLVAVDDSEQAAAAAALAARLRTQYGVEIVLAHVVGTREAEVRTQGEALVARVVAGAKLPEATSTIVEGEPVEAIVRAASVCEADAIVIGSHGRKGLARLFLGSVAENVVRHSPLPVLVVRA